MHPDAADYAPFYSRYIANVSEDDVLSALESQSAETQRVLARLDDRRATHRYESDKWSVKELLGHVTDSERVMAYRALAIARGETASLPGFDENAYVANAGFDSWRIGDLAEQYALVRRTTIILFRNLPDGAWARRGVANDSPVTVLALAHIILGHERHHLEILRERYGIE